MSRMSGSAPAGTPSMVSGWGSFAIFSTWLKSVKFKVSGSWAARSRAVALSANRAVITVSATVIVIGVSPVAGDGAALVADGDATVADAGVRLGELGLPGASP